jgi:protein-disulfide isomerase
MSKQARTRTRELREAQRVAAVKHQRNRRLVTGLGVLVILGLVAAIVIAVVRATGGGEAPPPAADGPVVAPANVGGSGSFAVGQAGAPVTVEIYYDYMCPACGAFEAANGSELDRLIEDGTIQVHLRPISFLDEQSDGTRYSTRAASAFATVVDGHPDAAWDFHSALYANQPTEGSKGLSDDQIAEIARTAGVPDAVVERFGDGTFEPWVASMTAAAFDAGLQGTPTITIDGQPFQGDPYSTGPLTDAIETAASGK